MVDPVTGATVAPTTVAFALSPGVAIQDTVKFETTEGRKLYGHATYTLDKELYDCKPDGLYQFLQSLSNRSQEFRWDNEIGGIINIPLDPHDVQSETKYLIDNYGMISLTEIKRFEESYIHKDIPPAQDAYMMYKCPMNSISKEGKNKILIWKQHYTIDKYLSGNLLLKIIIRESHLDTNAKTANIRKKLSSLDTYILAIGCDISCFNEYVCLLIDSLAARGETTEDLLTNLFKGYQAANDKVFVSYIGRKLEKHEEGETITSTQLMQLGDNMYKLLKESGQWNAPSIEEEKILALQTEVKKLQKSNKNTPRGKFPQPNKGDKSNNNDKLKSK
jgi:hypothetical protein